METRPSIAGVVYGASARHSGKLTVPMSCGASMIVVLNWLFALVLASSAHASEPIAIDVFVREATRLVAVDLLEDRPELRLRVHRVDTIDRLEATLAQTLPANADAAKRLVVSRLQALDGADVSGIGKTAEALLLIKQLGVAKVPAIVFDNRWVVYGVTDIARAHSLFSARAGYDR